MATETWQVAATAAETYEERLVPAFFAEWAPRLVEAAGVRQGDWVLDVACGTGIVARATAEHVGNAGRVAGFDLNPGMLAVARRLRPDLEWHHGDASALPFADGAFDRVLCQYGLMYFPDRVAALQEMRRVLAPEGAVGVAVWAALDQNPAFATLSDVIERHAGQEAANVVRSPFVLGELAEVQSLVASAGLCLLGTETSTAPASFPSVDAFVHAEVDGTPLAGMLNGRGDALYRQIVEEARDALRSHSNDRGCSFPMAAHLLVARG